MSGDIINQAQSAFTSTPKAKTDKPKKRYPAPLSVRFTDEERAILEQQAGDLSLSAYIRLCVLGENAPIYDDEQAQARAAHQSQARARDVLYGADPFEQGQDYYHYEEESRRRSKMQRPLMSPDEIMNMREDQQIIFISGQNLPPILANKYPYFTRREMAGLYLPNPYHPPMDRVLVQGRFRKKWLSVKNVPIPPNYRQFPQFKSASTLKQIEGYPV